MTETDPNGIDAHSPGSKLDAGKPEVLKYVIAYFPLALKGVAEVSAFGAKKYTYKGWETVPDGVGRYSEAMLRHLMKEAEGEQYDADSELLHAKQTAWNALARLELMLRQG